MLLLLLVLLELRLVILLVVLLLLLLQAVVRIAITVLHLLHYVPVSRMLLPPPPLGLVALVCCWLPLLQTIIPSVYLLLLIILFVA